MRVKDTMLYAQIVTAVVDLTTSVRVEIITEGSRQRDEGRNFLLEHNR